MQLLLLASLLHLLNVISFHGRRLFKHFSYKFATSIVLKPMALEQVSSDRDSEDEVDDDIADLEDRRVCLCKDEKCCTL